MKVRVRLRLGEDIILLVPGIVFGLLYMQGV
jgi:hypothetical protein